MELDIKTDIRLFFKGILNSYSQVFFSEHKLFALILLVITFIDVVAGFCGLFSVLITIAAGYIIGLDKNKISQGIYGFNSLLVGLGLGIYYEMNFSLIFILFLAAILTLFLAVSFEGIIGKYALPYLSVPFIFSFWLVSLATYQFEALGISERGIYMLNDLFVLGGNNLIQVYEWWNDLSIPESLHTYFLALGAIFFQFNVLAGIIISIGLLYYSRIAFSLSLIGFYSAFLFYKIIGANLTDLHYSYIGFNFILTAIAVGGFFVVPSRLSYVWTIILIPIVALLTISLNAIFYDIFHLPIYSLPFNIVVLMFLYILKFRTRQSIHLREVFIQQYSPEKNLYSFQNDIVRFRHKLKTPFRLPFWGEWTISQGHDGEHTHQGDWKHAWDFVITDDDGNQYKGKGNVTEDYFCFNKEVLAPGDGIVETIVDGIEDNDIGEVNLKENWGNTIVIKQTDFLFSKLSHLKKDSILHKEGDKIKQGDVVGRVGNSGRSPYPHLHFQFQSTPFIGSKTLDYPFSYYIVNSDKGYQFCSFDKPALHDRVSNIDTMDILKNAFHFIPGRKFKFETVRSGQKEVVEWEVFTDMYNNSYIKCKKTNSIAYFESDGSLLYFRHFEGNKSSLLYYLFLAAYKIQMGYYQGLTLKDRFPVNLLFGRINLFFQDFVAPFLSYLNAKFEIEYRSIDSTLSPTKIELESVARKYFFSKKLNETKFHIVLGPSGIEQLVYHKNNRTIRAVCIKEDYS